MSAARKALCGIVLFHYSPVRKEARLAANHRQLRDKSFDATASTDQTRSRSNSRQDRSPRRGAIRSPDGWRGAHMLRVRRTLSTRYPVTRAESASLEIKIQIFVIMNEYSFTSDSAYAILHKKIPKHLPLKHVLSAASGRRLVRNYSNRHLKRYPRLIRTLR